MVKIPGDKNRENRWAEGKKDAQIPKPLI